MFCIHRKMEVPESSIPILVCKSESKRWSDDYIHYVMINYDPFTQGKLESLASMVRNLTGNDKTLVINYLSYPRGHPPSNPKKGAYATAYYDYINGIIRHPCNRYFKVDDDVVYIHPGHLKTLFLVIVEKPVLFALQILLVQTGDAASFIKYGNL